MISITKHKEKIIGCTISIVFIILIAWNLDTQKLVLTFKEFNYSFLCIFIPLYIATLWIRTVRWKYILQGFSNPTLNNLFFAFTTSNTINAFLPARMGDFWRAYHIGNKTSQSKVQILGSIFAEKLIDGITITSILIFAITMYCKQEWVVNIVYAATFIFLGSLSICIILLSRPKINYINKKSNLSVKIFNKIQNLLSNLSIFLNKFSSGFYILKQPKLLFITIILSVISWGIECYISLLLIQSANISCSASVVLFITSFVALSTVIPSSSIFVGPYQYAYIMALGLYNINKANALGIAFVHQTIVIFIITSISILYILFVNTYKSDIKKEIEVTQYE